MTVILIVYCKYIFIIYRGDYCFYINLTFLLLAHFQVLKGFPESLQADICAHLHRNLFKQCAAFKQASEGCLRALALRFSARHLLPGHYIIKQGDEVKRLYFVAKGTIDVVQNGETVLSLGKYYSLCKYVCLENVIAFLRSRKENTY